jgi:uncharacterized protein (DUF1330 family)
MIYITQLIYINENQEDIFNEFESHAIPIIPKYNGELVIRVRPSENDFIEISIEKPYEIHIIKFESEFDFKCFMEDEERKSFLHLKEKSIKESFLIKGLML